jgi:hypothetical protein
MEFVFSVVWFMDLENVSTIGGTSPTPVALFAGVTDVTVGEVVSAEFAAVKVVTIYAVSVFPAKSRTRSCVQT